jgi:hypothetical protein
VETDASDEEYKLIAQNWMMMLQQIKWLAEYN